MTLQQCYTLMEGSYQDVLGRLAMERLVDRFLRKFPADASMSQLRQAVADGNVSESFRMAHTLKGVAANLGLTKVEKTASALTEQLRPLTEPADPALLDALEQAYRQTISAIERYEAEA